MEMEKIVENLKKIFRFKKSTAAGDVVVVLMENPEAMFYGLVIDIERDSSKRDEWWHFTMQILSFPPQKVTWTLRADQFTGKEIFTMGGERRYIRAVDFGLDASGPEPDKKGTATRSGGKGKLRLLK